MKNRITRKSRVYLLAVIVPALFSFSLGVFQMGTGRLQPAKASAQIGTTRFTARNIVGIRSESTLSLIFDDIKL